MSGDLPKKGINQQSAINPPRLSDVGIKRSQNFDQRLENRLLRKSFILREGQLMYQKRLLWTRFAQMHNVHCTWGWVRFGNQERRGNNASLGCFIIFRIIPVNKNQNENDYLNHKKWSGYNDDNLNRDNHRGWLLKRKQEIHSCETPVDALQQRPLPSSPSSSSWPLIIANSSSF